MGWFISLSADDILLSKSELLPAVSGKDEEAQTLAGKIFNSVHDALSPSAILTAEQKRDRAQHSDQLATVAADTLAMLPGLRLPAAGLLRATALLNVSGDLSSVSGNFVKDFAEGAALQKVSSFCLQEGRLGKALSAKLGPGLLAESGSFAAAGFGMGAVSSAFRQETWLDENKQFSALHGLSEIGKAGTVAGVMGAPAGLIGSKIGKFGMSLASEGRISAGSALFLSGIGGGYLSGAAVGGAQGYLNGGDLRSAFRAASEGGLAGALSGGVGLLALSRIQPLRVPQESAARSNERLALEPVAKNSQELEPVVRQNDDAGRTHHELWKSLEISSAKLKDSEGSLADRVAQLGNPVRTNMRYFEAAPNADQVAALSKSFSEFSNNGGTILVEGPIHMYSVKGVTISVPEAYMLRLNEVLKLRLKASEEVDLYIKGPGHARQVYQAQVDLEAHPLKDKAHPADFVQLLDELPDRSLVKDLFVREDRSPGDAWSAKEYEKGFRAAASAGEFDQRITFYGQNRSTLIRDYMKHEWSHLLKWTSKADSERFDKAAKLEKDGYYISKYSQRNNDENWAEHSASLLSPDPDNFLQTVHSAPLRSVEMTRALMKSLGAVSANRKGIHQGEIANRIAYVQQHIIPEAQETLVSFLKHGRKEQAIIAAELLSPIAGPKEFNLLSTIASTHANAEVREAAFNAAKNSVLQKRGHVSGYKMEYTDTQTPEMREFLISQAQPGRKSRESALELLSSFEDAQSTFHYDLLTFDTHTGNKTSRAIELLDRAGNIENLKLAWQTAMKAAGQTADDRVNLALRALHKYPRLINEVVDVFARESQPRTRPFLRDLCRHYDERVAQRARQGLQKLEMDMRVSELQKTLMTGKENVRLSAARSLAATKDTRATGYLLDAVLAAKPEEQPALLKVIRETLNQELWKFEVRQRKMRDPDSGAKLGLLMS